MCKNRYGVIYLIRNKVNNKLYFGQTVQSFNQRYKGNILNTHNNHLRRSIEKYGIENFEIDEEFDIAYSKEELDKLEDMYIKLYNTCNKTKGYNTRYGGANGRHTEETRKKMSKANKGKHSGEKHPNYGKHQSKETRIKISESNKGKIMSEESKIKMSKNHADVKKENNPMYGRKHTEKSKEKMSQNHKYSYGEKHARAKKIICLNNLEIFNTIQEASELKNIPKNNICACCKHHYKAAGKSSDGKKLVWMYYDEYLKLNKDEINSKILEANTIIKDYSNAKYKKVICITTHKIFNTITEASEFYKIDGGHISKCCKGKQKTCGKLTDGTRMQWMYYEDYLKLNK